MKEILFATGNHSKINQFQFVADKSGFDAKIISVYKQFPDIPRYSEEYDTQEKIVEEGAHEIFSGCNIPIVVEDTIFEVDALDGTPGLRANEFLKEHGRAGLLKKMEGVEMSERTARITSIVGYWNGTLLVTFKRVVEGFIAEKESYKKGEPDWIAPTEDNLFGGGYNAVFIEKTLGKTLADISTIESITYGYREPNFKALLTYLKNNN